MIFPPLAYAPGAHPVHFVGIVELCGEGAEELHREVGRYAKEKGVERLYTCGPLAQFFAEEAGEIARHFESREALIEALPELLQKRLIDHIITDLQ